MDNNKEKTNSSCIKIFKLLSLLYENDATYKNVIEIFKDEMSEQSTNNLQVVLNKYLNTLKIFGIKVIKKNRKYSIESSLYSIDYSLDDLKSINILLNISKDFPDQECSENITQLINNLKLRMNSDNRSALDSIAGNYNFSFYYSDLRTQIEECRKYCENRQQILVSYKKNKKTLHCKCQPKELTYDSKTAYISVYDIEKNTQLNILIPNIISITLLPNMIRPNENPTTVVFVLKNRLAKSYKIRMYEHAKGYNEKGELIIVNRGEPLDQLMSRLMRYSYNCEVISPKFIRDDMVALINETLNNYQ